MKRQLSKTTLALVFFTLTLILSIAGLFIIGSIYHPSYFISAHTLNYTPERYILLENHDSYTLQAINSGHLVEFYSYDDINIDEIRSENAMQFEHKYFYYKYNNSYYDISIGIADNIPPSGLPQLLLAGIIASTVAIVIISFYKTAKYVKNKVN